MAQDENKIYQIIYTDETGENTEQIEWTIEELQKDAQLYQSLWGMVRDLLKHEHIYPQA
ncbi:MAG: hypothetical protein IJS50_02915 [Desulfovibrio sp.]|nr:hypothetical protein [Desulfovibrio sp.]